MLKLFCSVLVSMLVLTLPAGARDVLPSSRHPSPALSSKALPDAGPRRLLAQQGEPETPDNEPAVAEPVDEPLPPEGVDAPEGADAMAAPAEPVPDPESAGQPEAEPADAADAATADAGNMSVLIQSIEITGNTVLDTATLQEKVAPFKNKELTLEEMGELADLITITYQEQGYILARAYLPEQEIQSGKLTIAVQEGKIGKILVTGGRHFDERVIKRYFRPQEKHGAIKESLLEKGLLLASEVPKIKTDIVLKEGEQPGEVDVVLNTQDSSKLTFGLDASIDYNNFGSELVSEDRFGTTVNIIDHRWGSELKVRAVSGTAWADSSLVTTDLKVPVNSHGTKVAVSHLMGNYVVGQEYADLGFAGETKNYGVRVIHPVIKKKNMNADLELGYEHKYSEQEQLQELAHIDELDGFALTVNFDNLDRFLGKNIASLQYFIGQMDRDDQYTPSRDNLDDTFQRLTFNAARVQKLYGYTNALARVSAQYSPHRLPASEQTILGGIGSVRGHGPSEFLGDSGYGVSAELMFAPPFIGDKTVFGQRLAQMVQFALFYDHGGVFNNDAEAGEVDSETLSGYGGGVRLFYKDRFTFKYDIGFPVDRLDDAPDHYNYFTGSLKFF